MGIYSAAGTEKALIWPEMGLELFPAIDWKKCLRIIFLLMERAFVSSLGSSSAADGYSTWKIVFWW